VVKSFGQQNFARGSYLSGKPLLSNKISTLWKFVSAKFGCSQIYCVSKICLSLKNVVRADLSLWKVYRPNKLISRPQSLSTEKNFVCPRKFVVHMFIVQGSFVVQGKACCPRKVVRLFSSVKVCPGSSFTWVTILRQSLLLKSYGPRKFTVTIGLLEKCRVQTWTFLQQELLSQEAITPEEKAGTLLWELHSGFVIKASKGLPESLS